MAADLLELSDLIVAYDPCSGERREVRQAEAVSRLERNGQRRGARLLLSFPAKDGVLNTASCDELILRAHVEMQRLNEEFLQVDRVRALLLPMLAVLRRAGAPAPYRVVDVGCGLGYLVRALAAHGRLGRDVELLGCDMNAALVQAADELAREEHLSCAFRVADAFRLVEPAHLFISTGTLHHFRGDDLRAFFSGQRQAFGFIHYDVQASRLAPLGAWLFHASRMRAPLARYDGTVSAARAHSARTLLEFATVATGLECRSFDSCRHGVGVVFRPMHAVVGIRSDAFGDFVEALGPLAQRLDVAR